MNYRGPFVWGAFVGCILGSWWLAAAIVTDERLLPGPTHVFWVSLPSFARFGNGADSNYSEGLKVLGHHTLITLERVIVAGIGALAALFVAILFYWAMPRVRDLLNGISQLARGVPLLALIPLFVFWFGGKPIGIYIYIGFGIVIVTLPNALGAMDRLRAQWLEAAKIYNLSQTALFLRVVLPGIYPSVVVGLRSSVGLCWAFSLGAEYLVARDGIGYLASLAYIHADMGKLICLLVCYGALSLLSLLLLRSFVDPRSISHQQ